MIGFTFQQWLLLFYIYCFMGWIWESCYVSAHERKWVNRGFLHGPYVPIYGFGAIIVLLSTLRVQDNYVLTFIFGMIGASILEYVTGACMEELFKVRYWDYSDKPFNLNGHICLPVSLGWGIFSLVMVNIMNKPFSSFVAQLPYNILELVVFVWTILMSIDTVISVQEALDLKEMLEKIASNNKELALIRERLKDASETINDDVKEFRIKVEENRRALALRLEDENNRLEGAIRQGNNKLVSLRLQHSIRIAAFIERNSIRNSEMLQSIYNEASYYATIIDEKIKNSSRTDDLRKVADELNEYKTKLLSQMQTRLIGEKQLNSSLRIIKRNPKAISMHYGSILNDLKNKKEGE